MSRPQCNIRLLRAHLESSLSPTEDNAVVDHVSKCERCQNEIRMQAAPEKSWNEAAEVLSDDEFDSYLFSGLFEPAESKDMVKQTVDRSQIKNVLASLNQTDNPN